jgi:hypothetical protein
MFDNKDGRLWALGFLADLHGRERMAAWLERLKASHKDTKQIEFYLRELED